MCQLITQPTEFTESFNQAFCACKSYPGMGDLAIQFNPYENEWVAKISFNDNSEYEGQDGDLIEALRKVATEVYKNPPGTRNR